MKPPRVFTNYADAVAACSDQGGYEAENLVNVVIEKTNIYHKTILDSHNLGLDTLRPLIAIAAMSRRRTLNVIDFGGGAGAHFFNAQMALGGVIENINWYVVETPSMVNGASKKYVSGLQFYSDLKIASEDLGEIDLVLASSSLQYTHSPKEYLEKLIDLNAEHMFITRTPLAETGGPFISVQESNLSENGPGKLPPGYKDCKIRYPIIYENKQNIEEIIKKKYSIRFTLTEGNSGFSLFGDEISMHGFFCVRL
jgi:putative methyltransferase (TIGR04325 family)